MKKLLIAVAILGLVGCSQPKDEAIVTTSPVAIPVVEEAPMEFGVDLADYPNVGVDFSLELDYQYTAVEKYGAVAFKAIGACFEKYEPMLDNIDTSTDYGAAVLTDFTANNEKCVNETLSKHDELPKTQQHKLPRSNPELDLSKEEIQAYDESEGFDKYANEDLSQEYTGDSESYDERLTRITAQCEDNNPGDESGTQLCIRKAM